jgi:integrase
MGTIRFFLRHDKPDKDGKRPIQLTYQISQRRERFQTKERVWPQCWDQENQKAKYLDRKAAKIQLPGKAYSELPTDKEIESINNYLKSLVILIRNQEKKRELENIIEYSPKEIVDVLRSFKPKLKTECPSNNVFDYIDRYIEEHKAIREPGSLQVYRSLKTHLLAFQKQKNFKIAFSDLDSSFFRKFQTFLSVPRKEKREIRLSKKKKKTTLSDKRKAKDKKPEDKFRIISLNNTTIAKQLSTLKTFIGYAKAEKIKISDDYKNFKIKKPNLEVIALTNEEFETLYNYDLSDNRRLDQVRDIFCFSCATGLRYSDLNQLRRDHIKGDEIRINIKKTKTNHVIPLNPFSSAILEKYSGNHNPLPVSGSLNLISNQVLNRYIKELCKKVGISEATEIVRMRGEKREAIVYPKYELISIHTGRKSFVTISLERGVPVQEVMATSGHTDYKSFARYVNITEKRKKEAMQKAWGIIDATKKKKHGKKGPYKVYAA